MKISVLYEDNHILVVDKPPNMPVQADASGDEDLLNALKAYIKEKYQKPGDVYLGLCHRLDRPVGGVMVFARTSKAAARLTAQFKGREAGKHYAAIVECPNGTLKTGHWREYIRAEEGALRVEVTPYPAEGAKEARLYCRPLAYGDGEALLDITLLTGRKHQIRAQCAAHGCPIRHDQRYHPNPEKGQIALWAYALSILHPTKKEKMEFFSTPKGPAFGNYGAALTGLPLHRACDMVYADENVLAVSKRAGIEVAKADAGDASLECLLESVFGEVHPVHRLDANTEGILLFARSQEIKLALEEALAQEDTEKLYHCIVLGEPEQKQALLEAWAKKDAEVGRLAIYDEKLPGAKPIITAYDLLRAENGLSLLVVRLHTGRTHQIRAHMAHIGHPVLGDDKYGDRAVNKERRCRRQQLLAKRLVLSVPGGSPLQYLDGHVFISCLELEEAIWEQPAL